MSLNKYKEKWSSLSIKKNLKGEEALRAVKEDGYALRYVAEQTEAICLEAVKQNGYALQFVAEDMFSNITEELTLEQVCKELGRDIKLIK